MHHQHVTVHNTKLHFVEAGDPQKPTVVLLHGWPQDWSAFTHVMSAAGDQAHLIAIDLPGIGQSEPILHSDKRAIARYVRDVIEALHLKDVTLVGHDIGGQIVFAYLKEYGDELAAAVIMDVVIPGIPPWEEVIRNPYIWHFAFHAIPDLPEQLVTGHELAYFDFFYGAIAAHPEAITLEARKRYVQAYAKSASLTTGFNWYRAFTQDAKSNQQDKDTVVNTPVLYIRGEKESGTIETYTAGLKAAGLVNLRTALIPASGHYAPEEQPKMVWDAIRTMLP